MTDVTVTNSPPGGVVNHVAVTNSPPGGWCGESCGSDEQCARWLVW